MAVIHKNLTGDEAIHPARYVQSSDPGSVGANKEWIDTTSGTTIDTGYLLKIRNGANSAWTTLLDLSTALAAKLSKSVVTTKGDILAATASATIARVGIGTDGQVLTADSASTPGLKWANASSASLADDSVTDAKLRNSAALSVIGRSANSSGDPADIAASSDGDVLRRSGTTLGFGTIPAASIGSGTVATARLGSGTASSTTFLRGDQTWATPAGAPGRTDAGNTSTALTIDWSANPTQKATLTGNCTFTFSNPTTGGVYVLELAQDGTGSRTATWPAAVHWSGGTAPTLTTTASKVDIFTFYYNGTTYFAVTSGLNFTA